MRISTQQLNLDAINSLFDQQAALNKTQIQVATGKRVLKPSDDPVASANTLSLNQTKSVTERYLLNADAAKTRLSIEEGALTSVGEALHRLRELAVQGNNSTYTKEDRRAISTEVRQILDEMLSLANTKDNNGDYLFAGFQGGTRPFAKNVDGTFDYYGDDGQRLLQVGASRQIADSDSGSTVFRTINNGNGIFTTQDNTLNLGSGIIDPGTISDSASYVADTYTIILGEQTKATGGAIAFFDDNANDTLTYDLNINGILINTYSEGDAPLLTNIETDINAQSAATGVTAYIYNNKLYLAQDIPGSTPIQITETLNGASEITDTVTGIFGSNLTGIGGNRTLTVDLDTEANGYVVLDGSSPSPNVIAGDLYQDGADISFNGISTNISNQPINGDRFTISPSLNQDIFTTIQNMAQALDGQADITTDAEFHNAMNRVLVDLDMAQDNVINIRANIGARLNAIDSQINNNEELLLQTQETLSIINDLDYAEAISRLNLQLTGLEAAQKAFTRVQGLSLFNYL